MRVFLSYAREDKVIAEAVAYSIGDRGHEVFFDTNSLPPGDSYESRIQKAIERSDVFVFLISKHSVELGRFTHTEREIARKKWPRPAGRVLPVMIAETDFNQIPAYLRAVNIFTPAGNIPADTAMAVQAMAQPPWRWRWPAVPLAAASVAVAVLAGAYLWSGSNGGGGGQTGGTTSNPQVGGTVSGPQGGGATVSTAAVTPNMGCSQIKAVNFQSKAIPAGRIDIANQIVSAFAGRGYGICQQIAALANAIAESGLNPSYQGDGGNAVGLFSFYRTKGTPAQLMDAAYSIDLALTEASNVPGFRSAATLLGAVSEFVHKVERPSNPEEAVRKRHQIAYTLAQ